MWCWWGGPAGDVFVIRGLFDIAQGSGAHSSLWLQGSIAFDCNFRAALNLAEEIRWSEVTIPVMIQPRLWDPQVYFWPKRIPSQHQLPLAEAAW
jgi:hypothetical protein